MEHAPVPCSRGCAVVWVRLVPGMYGTYVCVCAYEEKRASPFIHGDSLWGLGASIYPASGIEDRGGALLIRGQGRRKEAPRMRCCPGRAGCSRPVTFRTPVSKGVHTTRRWLVSGREGKGTRKKTGREGDSLWLHFGLTV